MSISHVPLWFVQVIQTATSARCSANLLGIYGECFANRRFTMMDNAKKLFTLLFQARTSFRCVPCSRADKVVVAAGFRKFIEPFQHMAGGGFRYLRVFFGSDTPVKVEVTLSGAASATVFADKFIGSKERQFFPTRTGFDYLLQFEGLAFAGACFACLQDNWPSPTGVPSAAGELTIVLGHALHRVFGYAAIECAVRALHEVYMPSVAFHCFFPCRPDSPEFGSYACQACVLRIQDSSFSLHRLGFKRVRKKPPSTARAKKTRRNSAELNCHPNNLPDSHISKMDNTSTAATNTKPSSGLLNFKSQSIILTPYICIFSSLATLP